MQANPTKNAFEQVDERQEDAITLGLAKVRSEIQGTVYCPAAITGGRLAEDQVSAAMPAVDAYRSAIKLANEIKAPVVVMDPEGLWQPEWGQLYRVEE
jgi:biotin carboxyl carrier protein